MRLMNLSWLRVAYTARKLTRRGGARAADEGARISPGLFHDKWMDDPVRRQNGTPANMVRVPLLPDQEQEMRHFYLTLLGIPEIDIADDDAGKDAFWGDTGMRQVRFGPPDPARSPEISLVIPNIDEAYQQLKNAGVAPYWDDSLKYVRRLQVKDPAGNLITLVGA
ncbi:hypothetical protein [Yoonia sp. I 8.24]|uniref:hypothetical protein n=1 Tax=Yoonia sp. I 8.24 TaxID=1537229 RepID=UPI001EDED73F|nr:hypothetical protein [Yoonia sp. I 8.24]MCG3268640.1 hypothetical protein [Yoonia sp. I 8.24]